MKKKFILVIGIFIVAIFAFLQKSSNNKDFNYFTSNNIITKLEITNGTTGEIILINDKKIISSIIDVLDTASYLKESKYKYTGYSMHIKIYSYNNTTINLSILSETEVEIDNNMYRTKDFNLIELNNLIMQN